MLSECKNWYVVDNKVGKHIEDELPSYHSLCRPSFVFKGNVGVQSPLVQIKGR